MGDLELAGRDPLPPPVQSDRLNAASAVEAADAVERRLDHAFADRGLLREALTHASVTGRGRRPRRSNERLEFLGDRVLGLVVAGLLIERFPGDPEGDLSRRHAALVSKETLAAIALELDLGRWIDLARSEQESGPVNPAILADCLEAVIGALYLDGGR